VHNTAAGIAYGQSVLNKMMQLAGMAVEDAPSTTVGAATNSGAGASAAAGASNAGDDTAVANTTATGNATGAGEAASTAEASPVAHIAVIEVDDDDDTMDLTRCSPGIVGPATPALGSAAGVDSPPGEDPTAAPAAAALAGCSNLAAESATPAAPTRRGRGVANTNGGGGARGKSVKKNCGRNAQAAKRRAASAALSQPLGTTRGLNDSSQAATTTSTTTEASDSE